MTEPSQYFKGRTVQEQMNEVIGYVDARAEEVAAAKADDVLEPAEQAKTDAIAAKEAAEDARDTTLAALPAIQQDIADLKAEDVSLDGRLDTVELKVQTAEGNIVTIQGQIVALQTADGQNVKLGGPQTITGVKNVPLETTGVHSNQIASSNKVKNELDNYAPMMRNTGNIVFSGIKKAGPIGFIRKQSASLNLTTPNEGTVTDETYVMEDVNGASVVSNFNSYTENSQTIYQISTKYPFVENDTIKITTGAIWLAVYKDHLTLFIRYTDKNGTAHLKTIANVTESDP